MSFDLAAEEEVIVFAEITKNYPSYSAASIASCEYVNSGKEKIVPAKLELYVSRLKASPAYGKVVGVGIKPKPTSQVVPYVRLDMDDKKGIHFNAVQLSDSSKKLAAVLENTLSMKASEREVLYMDYIKGIENGGRPVLHRSSDMYRISVFRRDVRA